MRIWGRIIKNNHLVKDMVAEVDDYNMSRTKKVYQALEDICYAFDLAKPIWLPVNQQDFNQYSRTRFTQDSFVEQIEFDYLDFRVIEEDY